MYRFANITLDTGLGELSTPAGPQKVEPQVFRLLVYLIEHRDRIVSKDDLVEAVWDGRIVSDAAITSRINLARAAVGDDGTAQRIIRTFPKRGFRFVADLETEQAPPVAAPMAAPRVLVLPFGNLSGDTDQDYLADGLTTELITELGRFQEFSVVAPRTSLSLRGSDPDVHDAARTLQAQFVVTGNMRHAGSTLRASVTLTDAARGEVMWSERYNRPAVDLFAMQDEIVAAIAAVLLVRIRNVLGRRASGQPEIRLTAHDLFLQASWALRSDLDLEKVSDLLHRAIDVDPGCAPAHAQLALIHGFSTFSDAVEEGEALRLCSEHAAKAVRAAPEDGRVLAQTGMACLFCGDHAHALEHTARALEVNPNAIEAVHFRGVVLSACGRPEEGLDYNRRAMLLDPLFPDAYREALMENMFNLRRYEEALDCFLNWRHPYSHTYATAAATLAHLGRIDEAQEKMHRFVSSRNAGDDLSVFLRAIRRFHKCEEDWQHWRRGFELAGLPTLMPAIK